MSAQMVAKYDARSTATTTLDRKTDMNLAEIIIPGSVSNVLATFPVICRSSMFFPHFCISFSLLKQIRT